MTSSRSVTVLTAGLAVITVIIWAPMVGHQFINYDDDVYVTANPWVSRGFSLGGVRWAFTTGLHGNWNPLVHFSHMAVSQFFGLNPAAHHLANLLLHAANSLLLFLVLAAYTSRPLASFAVASFFSLHPLHIESVAWVTERKDLLSGFFWMLALGAWLRYARRGTAASYLAVISAFILGFMSKPMVVTLPFVFLLLDYWPLGRLDIGKTASWKIRLLEKWPLFFLAAAMSVVAYLIQRGTGAMEMSQALPFYARLANAATAYTAYLSKTFWPRNLAIFYPHPATAISLVAAAAGLLIIAGISILATGAARRLPAPAVGWFWFVGTLVPVIGLVQIGYQSMADRYMYLPSIGLFVAAVWGFAALTRGRLLAAATAAALVALAVVTTVNLRHWQTSETVFRHAAAVTRNNYTAYMNLGNALLADSRYDEALEQYRLALKAKPDLMEAFLGMGVAYYSLGRIEDEINAYREAIRIQPDYYRAWVNLEAAYTNLGLSLEAAEARRRALEIATRQKRP